MFVLWKIIVLLNYFSFFVDCQFELQYLGHDITLDEYNDLEVGCQTKICLLDSQRLLLAATQNETIEPCDDFEEFSIGQSKKLGALNDRYQLYGFYNEVHLLRMNRYRKVLQPKINDQDIKPFKIAKNFYQNCINSDNIRKNATAKIIQHLRSLGGAPYLDSFWDEKDFKVKELIEKEAEVALYLFLNHEIQRCSLPNSEEIICLTTLEPKIKNYKVDEIIHLSKELKIDPKFIPSMYQKCQDFLLSQMNLSQIDDSSGIFTISQLNYFTNNTLNWLNIINSHLASEFQITENSGVLIEKPRLILKLIELMNVTPKATLANLFAFQFLYQLKALFIVYPFDENKRLEDGTNKSNQRWEQCTFYLFFIFNPALHALYAKTYHNEAVNWSMNNLLKEVIGDFIPVVNKLNISNDAKQDVVDKLITARYINGYPEEFLDLQKIDKFYEDLELNGTEEIIESYLKMRKYQFKINTSPSSYWKRMMDEFRKSEIVYFTKGNVIFIPPAWIQYPFYHPFRSRFFNTATFFQSAAEALLIGINDHLLQTWNIPKQSINTKELAYENYVKWEESGGKELQLPGFFLTNRQMYWVALANKMYTKIHPHNKKYEKTFFECQLKHFHLVFKNQKSFREAYNCPNMTDIENDVFKRCL